MYLTPEELNTSLYAHVVREITGGDAQIAAQAIEAAIEEVASYLGQRYDTDLIFGAEGTARSALILENTKVVAVWQIIKLSNAETIYEMWKERYDRVIDYLKLVAKGTIAPRLPLRTDEDGAITLKAKFGSNRKFNHEL